MSRDAKSLIDELKKKYSIDQLREVRYCRDEIRGLVGQDRALGYSDDEIEARMGSYLDEVYEIYQKCTERDFGISEQDFDRIYTILESIDGPVGF